MLPAWKLAKESKADLKVGLCEDGQAPSRAFVEADLQVGLACQLPIHWR